MSRIGKLAIDVPPKVEVKVQGGEITVKGPKGTLTRAVPPDVDIQVESGKLQVNRQSESRRGRAMHGLARALLANMVTGVSTGFTRVLEINGVGYRADVKGRMLNLSLGYSHPIEVLLPEGIDAKVEKNQIQLSGYDKEALGQLAAVIRGQRPPEPYKGKGIKYIEEHIRRKVGKAGAN
ncbi:MAG: 50S ribosomal protein L6 [Myxococcales bacterium]|nr:50S ribosomal protein L6 [Myxococcales bacterium]